MKKFTEKNCWKMFLEAIFLHLGKLFSEFPYKIFVTSFHDIIGLQSFLLSFCQLLSRITMCNLHWCYTFCTSVTLFALVLHLDCTALSQSESCNFFMCLIRQGNTNWPSNRIVIMKLKYIFKVETPPQHAICPPIQYFKPIHGRHLFPCLN